jgi:DNA-nicking Smr family endonuclease
MLDENASITTAPKSQPVPSSSSVSNALSTTTIQSAAKPVLESYEISRQDAHNHALKRKDCYLKADQANRHGMTGVASHYINQAREQTRLMKDANRIACEYLSRTRLNQFRQTHRLDLHELHADEALHLFKQVEQELNEGNRRTTPKSIEVITGYGKSSPYGGGYGKIRSVILTYLRQRNYK